jgi:hypothetical protein
MTPLAEEGDATSLSSLVAPTNVHETEAIPPAPVPIDTHLSRRDDISFMLSGPSEGSRFARDVIQSY